jgi:galactose mutarotase-like enzyme
MHTIENEQLKIGINPHGAELKSIYHTQHQLEYMWPSDPAYWAKSSPVLFPIVGQLKENQYRHKGQSYSLPRHGFAREKEFTVANQQTGSINFLLQSSEETLAVYPFLFRFSITYALTGDELSATYDIKNRGEEDMLFSVGGHPAFRVPLAEGTAYNDYKLVFNRQETTGRWSVTKEGTIGTEPQPLLQATSELPLTKELFAKDALVLKHLQSDSVQLVSDNTPHGLDFSFAGFPYLGLWAAPGADFVCIEPWCGIADSVDADGELAHKEGMINLAAGENFTITWKVRFF